MHNNIFKTFIDGWNNLHFSLCFIIATLLTIFIPSTPIGDVLLRYKYGFPLKFITIYQQEVTSPMLYDNLFFGNYGINLNPLGIFVNAIIIYFILSIIYRIIKR